MSSPLARRRLRATGLAIFVLVTTSAALARLQRQQTTYDYGDEPGAGHRPEATSQAAPTGPCGRRGDGEPFTEIIGNRAAPYITSLARSGASFTNSFAITRPSEPNYLALLSGSTQGLDDDSYPHALTDVNLASQPSAPRTASAP